MKEWHARSVIKAVSWRVIATLTTMVLVYLFTKEIKLSLEIGFLALIIKLFFYYMHERIWNNINWGKPKHPLEDLPVKKELSPEDKKKVEEQLKSLGYM
ncbi:DUF2061 domain-containing protein [Candidatus Omnitrophota bacterium]